MLAYADGVGRSEADRLKSETARRLVSALQSRMGKLVVAIQCLAELHQVLTRKSGLTKAEANRFVAGWRFFCDLAVTDEPAFETALELASLHQFQIYDAIIMAAAVHARCDLVLSDELQDGFAWRGVTVANPFAETRDPRLARLLA